MKTVSNAVQSLLQTRRFFMADLYAITLVGGGTLLYSGADCDLKDPVSGLVYKCGGMTGPYFEVDGAKSQYHQKLGTDVDQLVLGVLPGNAMVQGLPFAQAVLRGVFDSALFQVMTAYLPVPVSGPAWPLVATGTVVKFTGFVAEVDGGGSAFTFLINSALERLQSQWPRNLVSPGCVNVLGDASCGVNLAAFSVASTAASGSAAGKILCGLANADSYFDLGTLSFTSGANNGLSRAVRSWAAGTATLMTPFPAPPAVGDAFTITPGCDGTLDTGGCPKFNNIANFRGFPYVPPPTTAGA